MWAKLAFSILVSALTEVTKELTQYHETKHKQIGKEAQTMRPPISSKPVILECLLKLLVEILKRK